MSGGSFLVKSLPRRGPDPRVVRLEGIPAAEWRPCIPAEPSGTGSPGGFLERRGAVFSSLVVAEMGAAGRGSLPRLRGLVIVCLVYVTACLCLRLFSPSFGVFMSSS